MPRCCSCMQQKVDIIMVGQLFLLLIDIGLLRTLTAHALRSFYLILPELILSKKAKFYSETLKFSGGASPLSWF